MRALLLLALLASVGCGSDGDKKSAPLDESGISSGVIGFWELDSLSQGNHSQKADRPDPKDPFQERNVSDWTQLIFDDKNFTWISTNLVHYSAAKIPAPSSLVKENQRVPFLPSSPISSEVLPSTSRTNSAGEKGFARTSTSSKTST